MKRKPERGRYKRLLDGMTYKEGWRLSIDEERHLIGIEARVVDTETGKPIRVATSTSYKPGCTDAEFYGSVKWGILNIEHHEIEEWLRVGGTPVHDPHPEVTTRCTCEPHWSTQPSMCALHGNKSIYADQSF